MCRTCGRDGMVHGRVVRPPSYDARLIDVDTSAVQKMPGVFKVVRDGSFLAVIAERRICRRSRRCARSRRLRAGRRPPSCRIWQRFRRFSPDCRRRTSPCSIEAAPALQALKRCRRLIRRPYLMHGSIGPSCAVAQLRERCADGLDPYAGRLPRSRCDRRNAAHAEGKGALHPRRRVRLLRPQRRGRRRRRRRADRARDARPAGARAMDARAGARLGAYGPAMVVKVNAALDDSGKIVDWDYGVWSNTHSMRPGRPVRCSPRAISPSRFPSRRRSRSRCRKAAATATAIPLYTLPERAGGQSFPAGDAGARVGAARSLGAYMNMFAIESFMDELAAAAAPIRSQFRLQHLDDARAREVITTAAERFGWSTRPRTAVRAAVMALLSRATRTSRLIARSLARSMVDHDTGRARLVRAVAAVDSGQVVNPDGIAQPDRRRHPAVGELDAV